MIIEASPKNYHAYWKIDDCGLDDFSYIQFQLAARLGGDIDVKGLGTTMRIPGTINWKNKKPFLSRIVYLDKKAKPITLDFEHVMGFDTPIKTKGSKLKPCKSCKRIDQR